MVGSAEVTAGAHQAQGDAPPGVPWPGRGWVCELRVHGTKGSRFWHGPHGTFATTGGAPRWAGYGAFHTLILSKKKFNTTMHWSLAEYELLIRDGPDVASDLMGQ